MGPSKTREVILSFYLLCLIEGWWDLRIGRLLVKLLICFVNSCVIVRLAFDETGV